MTGDCRFCGKKATTVVVSTYTTKPGIVFEPERSHPERIVVSPTEVRWEYPSCGEHFKEVQ